MLGERLDDGELRRAEAGEIVEEHRDVEVGAPLRRGVARFPARHGVTEVQEAADRAVAAALHGLAQIDGVGERRQEVDDLSGHLGNAHRRRHLQFDDRDPGRDECIEACADLLELDRLVADVEDDAEVGGQRGCGIGVVDAGERRQSGRGGVGEQMLAEVADRLIGRLDVAERLRLEAQAHRRAGRRRQPDEVRHDLQDVLGEALDDAGRDVRLEAERRRLDRRAHASVGDRRKDRCHPFRVFDPPAVPPVRFEHRLHHQPVLERPVGKGVGGDHVEVLGGEERPQVGQRRLVGEEPLHRRRRQAERHGARGVGRHTSLHLGDVLPQARPQLVPIVGGVHQRRVGEVAESVGELHAAPEDAPEKWGSTSVAINSSDRELVSMSIPGGRAQKINRSKSRPSRRRSIASMTISGVPTT